MAPQELAARLLSDDTGAGFHLWIGRLPNPVCSVAEFLPQVAGYSVNAFHRAAELHFYPGQRYFLVFRMENSDLYRHFHCLKIGDGPGDCSRVK